MVRRLLFWGALISILAIYFLAVFPTTSLLSEHSQLNAAKAQLAKVESENRSLTAREQRLNSPTVIASIAKNQYGMVSKGQPGTIVLPGTPTTTPAG